MLRLKHVGTRSPVRHNLSLKQHAGSLKHHGCRYMATESTKFSILEKPRKEFAATYNAKAVEEGWYEWWNKQGLFKASSADFLSHQHACQQEKQPFTMITPPPNVTGSLHIGHALTFSIQDAIVRWRRMNGYDVKWIPGTDHAGIGTQSVVEKMLMRERGLSRHDLGREDFIKEVWEWKKKYGNHILKQMRRMGASLDWDSEFFTMDNERSQAVQNAFMRLYEEGLIYRDTRLVNWCCALETVISDIEVDYKDIAGRTMVPLPGRREPVEFGVLHNFSYKVVEPDSSAPSEITVSTTRIETMLGDCAIAIHPEDKRYQKLHGKYVWHPILNKKLPVICDESLVDMEFGTGAVKITPAHDPNDYACARRHNLPIESIFDKTGKLNENCGVPELVGFDRFDVREKVIDWLKEAGSYKGKDDKHIMRIAICSRSGDIIEPSIQPQWYINCKELARISRKQVDNSIMKILPAQFVQDWYHWLDNIQDWCISRQLWWGHEIPAYRIKVDDTQKKDQDQELWVVGSNQEDASVNALDLLKKKGYSDSTTFTLQKDEDVLDTWFSSGLLPLSALGWKGNKGEEIPARYPIQVMETGFDILFFWVARMAMLANHFSNGKAPFETVYLHAMIRDAQGRKMSKSLGNVIDPLHVIEGVSLEQMKENLLHTNLPEAEIKTSTHNLEKEFPNGIPPCGTDSLRFALAQYTQQSRQINLDISNVIQTSHFCNKLWNMFKFGIQRLQQRPDLEFDSSTLDRNAGKLTLVNRYMLSRMADAVVKCQSSFDQFKLFEVTDTLRKFIVNDVCDVYVEFSKSVLNDSDIEEQEKISTLEILHACMDISLRLAHPIMPYITEELWQHMKTTVPNSNPTSTAPSIMVESYPSTEVFSKLRDKEVEDHFKIILSIIHASRSLKQGNQISVNKKLPFTIVCNDTHLAAHDGPLHLYIKEIQQFTKASDVKIARTEPDPSTTQWTSKAINDYLQICVPSNEIVRAQIESAAAKGSDLHTIVQKKKTQLTKKLTKIENDIEKMHKKINQENYYATVPSNIREKNSLRLSQLSIERSNIENELSTLSLIIQESES